jgi:Cd2+/Zn2+-exporting ATPase
MSKTETCCSCCAESAKPKNNDDGVFEKRALAVKGAGVALFALALASPLFFETREIVNETWIRFALFLAAYLLIGLEVLVSAAKNISRGKVFDENFLMAIATIGAFCIGEYPEAAAVMLFYQVGEAFQDYAVGKSRKSISALMDIRPDYVNLKVNGEITRASPDDVQVGGVIVVKPGEKVPLDGVVLDGVSALDTSMLTGESLPRDVGPGDNVLSGFINKSGLLTIEVTKRAGESTAAKILDLVENAGSKKTPVENFITKFARWYTPCVVFCALALAVAPPLVLRITHGADFALTESFFAWLRRALVFLVVSCPCALVISIPLGFFGGIGCASRNGVLIKGSNYLEALNQIDTIVFDKTGTLTRGIFSVRRVENAEPFSQDELLDYASCAEWFSTHPIAVSIQKAYKEKFGKKIDETRVMGFEDIQGKGICAVVDGKRVLAGKSEFLKERGIIVRSDFALGASDLRVYVAVDGVYAGVLVIADEVKPDSQSAVVQLKKLGIRRAVMISGDTRAAAESLGKTLGIDVVFAEQLPHEKVARFDELERTKTTNGKLAFVGDGINDAPVLARSDVGIAMGALGSDAAIEAADVVLMTDELTKLVDAVKISRRTRAIVWQNIIFALAVKAVLLGMGALGLATLWEAVFGDVGVAVIAVLNSMRALRYRRSTK